MVSGLRFDEGDASSGSVVANHDCWHIVDDEEALAR